MRMLKVFYAVVAIAPPLAAQPSNLTVLGTTATQAVISYKAPTEAACAIEVSESPSYSPVVNDVNAVLFPGAATDTGRLVLSGDQSRLVIIGKRNAENAGGRMHSRALRAATRHYARVSCGGNAGQLQFQTAETSGLAPETPPFDPAADGNLAIPDFDWSNRGKPVIDPQTGVAIYRIGDPRDYSSNTAHNFAPGLYFGGAGWDNPSHITSATTSSLAVTSNTNPIFLPVDSTAALSWGGWANTATAGHPVTDMAIHLFGTGTSTAANRTIEVCLSVDSGGSCYSSPIEVVIPASSASDLGLTPSSYPDPLFAGWSKVITREFFSSVGKVTVTNGAVTLTKDDSGNLINSNFQSARARFHQEWPAGAKIFIANSAPACANDYCTIASVQSHTSLTLSETPTLAENTYRFAGLGFRITKKTSSGSVSLSASYRLAKSFVLHQGAGSGCSTAAVQTTVDRDGNPLGRTITGYLCVFPMMFESAGRLYFVGASEPESRLLSLIKQPASIAGHVTADLPNAGAELAGPNFPTFDSSNPNIFYAGLNTMGGSKAVFKITYSGDYRENAAAFWSSSADSTPATGAANLSWENTMKSAAGKDVRAQVLANTSYNETQWGPLSSNVTLVGFAGQYAVFNTAPAGGGETPCWIFVFHAQTGAFARAWNTLNGGGEGSLAGTCHNVAVVAGKILVTNNGARNSSSGSQWGGPFEVAVASVRRSGMFSANTGLPGLPDGTYDDACPADLPQKWKDQGATGNQCVTIRINGEPCSAFATANEKIYTPCPTDAAKSWVGAPITEGQDFYNASHACDNEHLQVVRRTDAGGGFIELVMLRDAGPGYCCNAANARGRACVGSTAQAVHANGWVLRMTPKGSCCSCPQIYDAATGTYLVEEQTLIRGHVSYELLASGNHTFLGIGVNGYVSRYDAPASAFGQLQTASYAQWPKFASASSDYSGAVQSYIAAGGAAAGDYERRFATDWRHPNGGTGVAPEAFGQTIGVSYTLTLESGTATVYKVSAISGSHDPKRTPLLVWAGKYILSEKSSAATGDTLSDADPWRFCYALRSGECRAGSAAGELYVAVPGIEAGITQCHASQISYRSLCVFAATSIFGQITHLRIDQNDPAGLWQRRLGYGLTRPGSQYVYSKAKPFSDGKAVTATAWNLQGVYSTPILMQLPPWPTDTVNRTSFVPVLMSSSGSSYVEFGYEEFGGREQFFCTARAESCRVAADKVNEQNPFSFAHQPLTTASGNWTIAIPALPGRILYYRAVTGGVPGETRVEAVP